MRRMILSVAMLLAVSGGAVAGPAPAPKAAPKAAAKAAAPTKVAKPAGKGTTQQCWGIGAKRKCQRVAVFSGQNTPTSALRKDPLAKPSGDVWLRAVNLNAEVRANIYKADGSFDEETLAMLDELFRCVATNEVRAVNAKLYEHLSRINDQYAGKPVELVSGFRYAERSSSRHFHASAMDVRVPGVSAYELQKFAGTFDQGKDGPDGGMGIGIYPASGFVHIDFRAPGEPSFRWTDWSGSKRRPAKKAPGRTQPARKPTS
ncbi:MAG TPA: DUF882 domain-containing protein [Kofleriaceae bacterium]|nr:DUF882 domain-containing protein [Kofleriaceae bacterium]